MKDLALLFIFPLLLLTACSKGGEGTQFKFKKDYCDEIFVGGFVGNDLKCFEQGEIVTAEHVSLSTIEVRIAGPFEPDSWPAQEGVQELMAIPKSNVRRKVFSN